MQRERNDAGQYREEYTAEEVLDAFETAPVPVLTAPEVAEALGWARTTARNRLEELVQEGRLYRKPVGSRAVVYVRLEAEGGRLSGYGPWKQSLWEE